MKSFKITPCESWYTNRNDNRRKGKFITKTIDAFYHSDYQGGNDALRNTVGTVENVICTVKNQFLDKSQAVLKNVCENLIEILKEDLPKILQISGKNNLSVCVIPRSKAEMSYDQSQLLFKKCVGFVAQNLQGFSDCTTYIIRHTDTRTTHLDKSGHGGRGDLPYPGITCDTCTISEDVNGKNILLIVVFHLKN